MNFSQYMPKVKELEHKGFPNASTFMFIYGSTDTALPT
jgi:hypothetical protein